MNPLDIETIEQEYSHKEYGNGIKITAKTLSSEDNEKAIKFMEWVTKQEKFKELYKEEMLKTLLTGHGIDPVSFMKTTKKGINIPIELIRKELGYGDK